MNKVIEGEYSQGKIVQVSNQEDRLLIFKSGEIEHQNERKITWG